LQNPSYAAPLNRCSRAFPRKFKATTVGILCRRPYWLPLRRYLPSFPSLRGEPERKARHAWPSHPPGTIKTLEPGIRRSVTAASRRGLKIPASVPVLPFQTLFLWKGNTGPDSFTAIYKGYDRARSNRRPGFEVRAARVCGDTCYASHYFAFPKRSGVTLRPGDSGGQQTRPGPAGSVSELKPSGTKATGRRRSLNWFPLRLQPAIPSALL
jgi:hypothetical protein